MRLVEYLPNVQQYLDCPTCFRRTIDRCYGNIPLAFKAICRLPLGKSDQNIIHLLPRYRAMVKRLKTLIIEIHMWTEDCKEKPRDCFGNTNWEIFFQFCKDVYEPTNSIHFYLKFCEENVWMTKKVKIFQNKSWVSKHLKNYLNKRKLVSGSGDRDLLQKTEDS